MSFVFWNSISLYSLTGLGMHQRRNQQRNYPPQRGPARAGYLENGTCGVFFTVDGEEKRAVREANNLLDIFSPGLLPTQPDPTNDDHKQDISDQLTKMCESTRDGTTARFRQLDSGWL